MYVCTPVVQYTMTDGNQQFGVAGDASNYYTKIFTMFFFVDNCSYYDAFTGFIFECIFVQYGYLYYICNV